MPATMKELKNSKLKTSVLKAGRNAHADTTVQPVRLRGISAKERKEIRIPSYQYLLP